MSWIPQVRDALKWAWGTLYEAQDEPIDDDDRGEALEKIGAAIKAIPETDPMQDLLEWLYESRDATLVFEPYGTGLTTAYKLYSSFIQHIEEMGYKLPEEEKEVEDAVTIS